MLVHQIYYVDDDIDDIEMFVEAVNELRNKEIITADLHVFYNGDSLLNSIKENIPENGTIFLDINMPEKTGLRVLSDIRKNPALDAIPVIMYSTCSDINEILKSRSMGANLYAVKPNSFNEIIAVIKNILHINWQEFKKTDQNFNLNPGNNL